MRIPLVTAVLALILLGFSPAPQDRGAPKPDDATPAATQAEVLAEVAAEVAPTGVIVTTEGLADGYVLFSPLTSGTTYLIDRAGAVVHTWETDRSPGASVYLLDDGSLLRPAREHELPRFTGGGQGGRIQRFGWDGELVWEYELADERMLQHHDVEWMPNGNVLVIAWEGKSREQALYAGRRPDRIADGGIWPDVVLEIEPTLPAGGKIVWEWHTWDHRVQDTNRRFDHYGQPSENIGRIDINGDAEPEPYSAEELQQLRAMGYVGGNSSDDPPDPRPDWLHTNSIAYDAASDRILLSTPRFNEVWMIDHSTTSAEAAGSRGGRSGKGGDLLWRWGNPRTHGRGTVADQQLFGQHDARWTRGPADGGDAARVLIFDNGSKRPEGKFSRVLEVAPGTDEPVWSYVAPEPGDFYSAFISGAHPMANGHVFVCAGATGRFFEVTRGGEIVWEYRNPYVGDIRTTDGKMPQPGLEQFPKAVFRATFIPADHPGLAALTSG